MWISTITSKILERVGEDRRRVISSWRLMILARRIAIQESAPLPDANKVIAIERELLRRSAIIPVKGLHDVFVVDVPFARVIPVSDEQIIQEANPWAVFSHLTAMVAHGITDVIPAKVYVTDFASSATQRVPLGTEPQDWIDMDAPVRKLPAQVREVVIDWLRSKAQWDFGTIVTNSQGIAIYVTDLERTLLDSLRHPEKCGGILTVARAWRSAADSEKLNVNTLADYTDRLGIAVVRQRVGYFLQSLGLPNIRLNEWKSQLRRGGSMKMLADSPYSPVFSEEWNLSLNVPASVLNELRSNSGG